MVRIAFFALIFLAAGPLAARAQTTPAGVQALIAAGNPGQALAALQPILAAHPDSAVAWFLDAEAQDAAGSEDAARTALAKADQLQPGLPFANQADLAALRAHLAQTAHAGFPLGSLFGILFVGLILFVLYRLFIGRRRYYAPPPAGFRPDGAPYPGYGPPAGGGGWGSSLFSGLLAGAGFAAGERVVDSFLDRNDGVADAANVDNSSSRDDGLSGSPDWGGSSDDSSGSSDGGW
jgi:hypothetical protein